MNQPHFFQTGSCSGESHFKSNIRNRTLFFGLTDDKHIPVYEVPPAAVGRHRILEEVLQLRQVLLARILK